MAETEAAHQAHQAHRYVIFPIMPSYEIHLISGPSNAGKTTLLFQIIEEWRVSRDVLGAYKSYPAPFAYLACDRSESSIRRTLDRISLPHEQIPMISLIDAAIADMAPTEVLKLARRKVPDLRVLFVDAIAVLCPGKMTDYGNVCRFLTSLARLCQREQLTIVGLGHTAKVRGDDKVSDPRQRFLGSVAWGGFADCMIHIEMADPDDPTNPNRQIYVLPKNTRSELLDYHFNDQGRLVCSTDEASELIMDGWLKQWQEGHVLTSAALRDAGMRCGLSRPTVFRWIKVAVEDGRLLKSGRGEYQVRPKN